MNEKHQHLIIFILTLAQTLKSALIKIQRNVGLHTIQQKTEFDLLL